MKVTVIFIVLQFPNIMHCLQKYLWLQNRRQNKWMSPSSALVFTGTVNTNNWLQISATEQWEWKAEYYKVFFNASDWHTCTKCN